MKIRLEWSPKEPDVALPNLRTIRSSDTRPRAEHDRPGKLLHVRDPSMELEHSKSNSVSGYCAQGLDCRKTLDEIAETSHLNDHGTTTHDRVRRHGAR